MEPIALRKEPDGITIRPADDRGGNDASAMLLPNGRLEFGPRYDPRAIAEVVWQCLQSIVPQSGQALKFCFNKTGVEVALYEDGRVVAQGHEPDAKAMELWREIIAQWPKQ